jgi:hypothetical protein
MRAVSRLRIWILLGALAAFAAPLPAAAKAKVIVIKSGKKHRHKGGKAWRHRGSRRRRLRR